MNISLCADEWNLSINMSTRYIGTLVARGGHSKYKYLEYLVALVAGTNSPSLETPSFPHSMNEAIKGLELPKV